MGQRQKILVKPHALGARGASLACGLAVTAMLCACGQRGPLTLPNDNEFKQRATLPDIVRRQLPDLPGSASNPTPVAPSPKPAASGPSTPASPR